MKTVFLPKTIGQEELDLRSFWRQQPEFFRILWVPSESHWAYFTNLHPQINATEMKRSLWESYTHNYGQGDSQETDARLTDIMSQTYSKQLLGMYSVKYVAVIERNRQYYDSKISQLDYLKKMNFNGAVSVYENENFMPALYLTKNLPSIQNDFPYQKVEFKTVSPAQYEINIKNISSPVFLNFSYQYDPNWKIKTGNFDWLGSIWAKNYFYPQEMHFSNDAKLNSFLIDPPYIKKNNPSAVTANPDGSYDIHLTLFYRSQSYFYLGLIFFILVVTGCLAFLMFPYCLRGKKEA